MSLAGFIRWGAARPALSYAAKETYIQAILIEEGTSMPESLRLEATHKENNK